MVELLKKFINKFFKRNTPVALDEKTLEVVLQPQEVKSESKVSRKERLREIREVRNKGSN
jgi:hypothetical protein